MRVVIISHTEHYRDKNDHIYGWGPTIRELNFLAKEEQITELIHVAPLHKGEVPRSSMTYTEPNIRFESLKPSGGHGFKKLSLITHIPYNISKIYRSCKQADWIQFRAPTGIGMYVLPYLALFKRNQYWVKYAGNWIDPDMPLGNKLQKKWLKYVAKCKVTINGNWEKNERIVNFENPSMSEVEYKQLKSNNKLKSHPDQKGWRLIFIGALNKHKGVHLIIDALRKLKKAEVQQIDEMVFVGDGLLRSEFEHQAESLQINCRFCGFLDKPGVFKELEQAHALILPSKSEGFPKVVGEAMAAGCIPIVSDISCIREYIEDGKNGFVLDNICASAIYSVLKRLFCISNDVNKGIISMNQKEAQRFTYEYYNQQLMQLIFRN